MADENYTLPEVPVYREAIRKILNEDPVNAEEVLNPLVQALLENVHFVKLLAQAKAESAVLDDHIGDDTVHLTTAERAAWNGKAEGNHSHTAADVGAVPTSQKGKASGVATLGTDAKVPKAQLPASEGKRTARFTVGTSTAGWTADQVDYLCDGTADQEEINAAITALPANGGEVVILDGTYNLAGSVKVNKSNVTLSGNGKSVILKRNFNGDRDNPALIYCSVNDVTIRAISLEGVKSIFKTSSNNDGIIAKAGSSISDVICKNCASNGISVGGDTGSTISNNICTNCNVGIAILSSYSTITGNLCSSNATGIQLNSAATNNTIIGNNCSNCTSIGIEIKYFSSSINNTISGNVCNACSTGIEINAPYNSIIGNTIIDSTWNGIQCGDSPKILISGNLCRKCQIGISGYACATITGNLCVDNRDSGIAFSGNGVTVTGNDCIDNVCGIVANGSNSVISGNTAIRGSGTSADYGSSNLTIHINGSNNLIVGNNIRGKNYTSSGTNNTFADNKY